MDRFAAVFDMDGTVLDTLEDLKNAINFALESTGHKAGYTKKDTAYFFGSGVHVALQRALALEAGWSHMDLLKIGTPGFETVDDVSEEEVERLKAVYMPYYPQHSGENTVPYDGILELLQSLRAAGVKCAVVSNKPDGAVQTLCEELFPGAFDYALGEKPELARKPAPDMVNASLDALEIDASDAVYIGDSEIDIETAENSDLTCISVTWGFRPEEFLRAHGAQMIVNDATELRDAILSVRWRR